jgi:hypothetical protein
MFPAPNARLSWAFLLMDFIMSIDRERLVALLDALDASPRCLERPNCRGWIGDWQITGKHGHAMTDDTVYLLYAQATPRRWTSINMRWHSVS